MPYFSIAINGRFVACAGSENIRVLTASFGTSGRYGAHVGASGHGVAEQKYTHFTWLSCKLLPKDRVVISYIDEGKATEAETTFSQPERPLREMLRSLKEGVQQIRKSFSRLPVIPKVDVERENARLRVCIDSNADVDASLGDAQSLQAVLTFVEGSCRLEVDFLTVLPGGWTEGTRWLASPITLGQSVTLAYDIDPCEASDPAIPPHNPLPLA